MPKPKNKKTETFFGTMMDVEKLLFLVFVRKKLVFLEKTKFSLGKSWFFRWLGYKNQLFPKEKLVFTIHGLDNFVKNQIFPRKTLVFGAQASEKQTFS